VKKRKHAPEPTQLARRLAVAERTRQPQYAGLDFLAISRIMRYSLVITRPGLRCPVSVGAA
jgi:hypothetical protein